MLKNLLAKMLEFQRSPHLGFAIKVGNFALPDMQRFSKQHTYQPGVYVEKSVLYMLLGTVINDLKSSKKII